VERMIVRVLIIMLICLQANARTFFVSPSGNDLNPGTIDLPFKTIARGVALATAGDTILVRAGTHVMTGTLSISRSGTVAAPFNLFAFAGERPVLDFSAAGTGSRGINLTGSYWYIKGLDIYRAPDNGMHVTGSNNRIELCIFRENGDTGLQLDTGAGNNQIINCDSYFNVDVTQGNADGFAPKLTVGTGNYFFGCRAWQNSDDGWDGYLRPADNMTTTLENCWTFHNGYLKNGSPSTGNGNGFKMGGGDNGNADSLRHNVILKNCLAFDNRVKGYDQNNNRGSMTLLNCTGYRNGTNYQITGAIKSGSLVTVKNCVALGALGGLGSYTIQATNSWMPQFTVTTSDFVSIDTTGARGPRNADGSLPVLTFMHLAAGSDLIDAGTNVGLPFNGSAPDLGCFETSGSTSVGSESASPQFYRLDQNYPNPFNPATTIRFTIGGVAALSGALSSGVEGPLSSHVKLTVFDILGREVATLVNEPKTPGEYSVQFDAGDLSSGVFFGQLRAGNFIQTQRMLLLR
jgi:hypothetical protein